MRRALVSTVTVLIAGAGLVGLGQSPAAAAWDTSTSAHGAQLQVCRGTVAGKAVLRFRLDNRQGKHAHRGGVYSTTADRYVEVRAAAGAISRTRQVPIRSGDSLESSAGEIGGPTQGGGIDVGAAPRC